MPLESMTKNHLKLFLLERGISLDVKDQRTGIGPLNGATKAVLLKVCNAHKEDEIVQSHKFVDDDFEEDDDEENIVFEDDPSVPCPAKQVDQDGVVNEIKIRQVLHWLMNAETDREVLTRLFWLSRNYPSLKSYCSYLKMMRKYWSRWNKCWETTFGFQSTQGSESWHWSIKAPLKDTVIRADEAPNYLYDIYEKKENKKNRSLTKFYCEGVCVNYKNETSLIVRQVKNLFGGSTHNNNKTIDKIFNKAGTII